MRTQCNEVRTSPTETGPRGMEIRVCGAAQRVGTGDRRAAQSGELPWGRAVFRGQGPE